MNHFEKVVQDPDAAQGANLLAPVPGSNGRQTGKAKMLDNFNKEIKKWTERLRQESIAHRESAKQNKCWYFFFGFLPISLISAATSFVSQTDLKEKDMIILLLSCTNALCAGIAAYWNWGELAEKHSNASKQLDLLLSDAYSVKYSMMTSMLSRNVPLNESADWKKFQTLSNSYNKVKNETPLLSAKYCRKVDAHVKAGVDRVKQVDVESPDDIASASGALETIIGEASATPCLQPSITRGLGSGVINSIFPSASELDLASPLGISQRIEGLQSLQKNVNPEVLGGKAQNGAQEVWGARNFVAAGSVAPGSFGRTTAGHALNQVTKEAQLPLSPHQLMDTTVEKLRDDENGNPSIR
jgi:hypothetical protein